ncbi:class I SAM-dependent methyltransferase [Acidobacteriota bacterium]
MNSKTSPVRCNLCQSDNPKIAYTKFGLNLVRCKNCGLIYAHPRLRHDEIIKRYNDSYFYDEYLPIFEATRNSFDLEILKSHYSDFLSLIETYSCLEKNLIDVGCGPGFFLKAAEEWGWQTKGVEISKVAADYANKVVHVDVYNGRLEDAELPSGSFNVVTLLDVIEHLENPKQTLRQIHRILNKGGKIILNTPDYYSLSRNILKKDWAVLSPAEHLYNFSQKTLSQMLSEAGFRVIEIQNLFSFDPDCTHNKKSWRYKIWKTLYGKMKEKTILKKIYFFERSRHTEISQSDTEKKHKDIHSSWNKKFKLRIYKTLKKCFRGDKIIAVAEKIEHESETDQ